MTAPRIWNVADARAARQEQENVARRVYDGQALGVGHVHRRLAPASYPHAEGETAGGGYLRQPHCRPEHLELKRPL